MNFIKKLLTKNFENLAYFYRSTLILVVHIANISEKH
jgi:hypothetical protein